jgi:hypothetical protein
VGFHRDIHRMYCQTQHAYVRCFTGHFALIVLFSTLKSVGRDITVNLLNMMINTNYSTRPTVIDVLAGVRVF